MGGPGKLTAIYTMAGKQPLQQMADTGIGLAVGKAKAWSGDILKPRESVRVAGRQEEPLLALGPANQHQVPHASQTQGGRIVVSLTLRVPDVHASDHRAPVHQALNPIAATLAQHGKLGVALLYRPLQQRVLATH